MSDPIFQTRSLRAAFWRAAGSWVFAPLLAVLVLASFFHILPWTQDAPQKLDVANLNALWLMVVFCIFAALVPAILAVLLSTEQMRADQQFAGWLVVGGLAMAVIASLYGVLLGQNLVMTALVAAGVSSFVYLSAVRAYDFLRPHVKLSVFGDLFV